MRGRDSEGRAGRMGMTQGTTRKQNRMLFFHHLKRVTDENHTQILFGISTKLA